MDNIERALLNAVILDPKNDTPRLIYADHMEEIGQIERASEIREMIVTCEARWRKSNSLLPLVNLPDFQVAWIRGFAAIVHCHALHWAIFGPEIVQNHPIEHVDIIGNNGWPNALAWAKFSEAQSRRASERNAIRETWHLNVRRLRKIGDTRTLTDEGTES